MTIVSGADTISDGTERRHQTRVMPQRGMKMTTYATSAKALAAARTLAKGECTHVAGREELSYHSNGDGSVTRIVHYCNAGAGRSKITHRERLIPAN